MRRAKWRKKREEEEEEEENNLKCINTTHTDSHSVYLINRKELAHLFAITKMQQQQNIILVHKF